MQSKSNILNGLILAGGKSVRMGQDKGLIKWHGKEQQYYIADFLLHYCKEVFISCRTDQQKDIDSNYKTIQDVFPVAGPISGILSAVNYNKKCPWLVVACDLPLIDEKTIEFLIKKRNRNTIATAYKSPYDGLPEPLIAIWEPRCLSILNSALLEQKLCPRKVLINNGIKLINPPYPEALINANTPEDVERVRKIMEEKTNKISAKLN